MDWPSFILGFVAFPASLLALCYAVNLAGIRCRAFDVAKPAAPDQETARMSALRASFDAASLASNGKRIDELAKALRDMTLMRDMLIQQVQSEGIDPVVHVTPKH